MIRTLVTGGAGFIGSHLVEKLYEKQYEVVVVDDFSTGSYRSEKAEFVSASITDKDALSKAMEGVGVVFHQAAQVSVPLSIEKPEFTRKVNVNGTKNVLDCALKHGVKRVIFASSAAVYPDVARPVTESDELGPQNPYGESKMEAEALMRSYFEENGLETVSLRYFNVYGPRQKSGVISIFFNCILSSKQPVIFGDGSQSRDFINVEDVVRANIIASSADVVGKVLNIATGKPTSLSSLIKLMEKVTGKNMHPEIRPARAGDIKYSCADTSLATRELGFTAEIELEDGLRRTYGKLKVQ